MRGMRLLIFLSILPIVLLESCGFFNTYSFKSEDLIAKFSSEYTPGNDGLLNTDGYYLWENRFTYDTFIFKEDGTALKIMLFKNEYLDSIGHPTTMLDNQIKRVVSKGIYQIVDNQIIVDDIGWIKFNDNFWGKIWELDRYKFEIVNKNEIHLIGKYEYAGQHMRRVDRIYRFVKASPLPEIPEYDTDDKKNKKIWESEEEWKAYMQKIKEHKRALEQQGREQP